MDRTALETLQEGDVVRHAATGDSYVVKYCGTRRLGVRTVELRNPQEWEPPFHTWQGIDSP